MKSILIAIGMLLVSTNALPQSLATLENQSVKIGQRDPIAELIQSVFDMLAEMIVEAGFDPLVIEEVDEELNLFDLAELRLRINNLRVEGVSNFALNNFAIDPSVSLDVSMPAIRVNLGLLTAQVEILGGVFTIDLETSGSLAIINPGIDGSFGINIGVDGIGLSDVNVHIKLEDIQSNGRTIIMGEDVSDVVNDFINITIPQLLRAYDDQLAEVLGAVVEVVFEIILGLIIGV